MQLMQECRLSNARYVQVPGVEPGEEMQDVPEM